MLLGRWTTCFELFYCKRVSPYYYLFDLNNNQAVTAGPREQRLSILNDPNNNKYVTY